MPPAHGNNPQRLMPRYGWKKGERLRNRRRRRVIRGRRQNPSQTVSKKRRAAMAERLYATCAGGSCRGWTEAARDAAQAKWCHSIRNEPSNRGLRGER